MSKIQEQLLSQAELLEIEKTDLYQALTHPKFLRGIRSVARHTRSSGIEAGLAVYQNNGLISVSAPILPKAEELRKHSAYGFASQSFRAGYQNFNADPLILVLDPQTREIRYRDDVVLILHSHPKETSSMGKLTQEQKLLPSTDDIEAYEDTFLSLPGLTEAILYSEKSDDLSLMLYKKSPNRDYMQYYKAFFSPPDLDKYKETLIRGGINLVELPITRDEAYVEQVVQAVTALEI